MKPFIVFLLILVVGLQVSGQQKNEAKIQLLQEKIAQLVGELQKETQLNTMKHVNQVEGFKDGLWIESTNGEFWFTNYKMGLKDGKMNVFYTSGKKYVEAEYKEGFLIGKVTFYDTKGVVEETYEKIVQNDSIVEIQIEKAEGDHIYFTKEKHRYDYKAYMKRYTADGILYTEGLGLFDDKWIFKSFKVGEWISHEN